MKSIKTLKELEALSEENRFNYLSTLKDDNALLIEIETQFFKEHGQTGRLEQVKAYNYTPGDSPTLVVRVNRGKGKTRIPSHYYGLIVRKWYTD